MRSSLAELESLEIDGDKEGNDSTECIQRLMDHQLRGVRALRKTALCTFSRALSEKESINTSSDELDHFLKMPALDPDSNALEWWKTNVETVQSSETAVVHPCYVSPFWKDIFHFRKYCHKEEGQLQTRQCGHVTVSKQESPTHLIKCHACFFFKCQLSNLIHNNGYFILLYWPIIWYSIVKEATIRIAKNHYSFQH